MAAPIERFMAKVEVTESGCWLWKAHTNKGYARFNDGTKTVDGHRWSYEHHVGPIPEGKLLDHTCHTNDEECEGGRDCLHRRCVNPSHLEPVSTRENTLRGRGVAAQRSRQTHCVHGHEFTEANTWIAKNGTRTCRRCRADSMTRDRVKKREARCASA